MKKSFVFLMLVMALALVLTGCGPKTATLDVEMKDFSFTPDVFEVPAGATVTMNLKNSGTVEHEYVIMILGKDATPPFSEDDEPNIFWEHELGMGESETVTFTAPTEPGDYYIVCGIPAHLEQGMRASLTVK